MEVTLLSHTLNTKSALLEENLEFKAAAGAYNIDELQGIVECFVAGIGNKDSVGDIVLPGAFNDSLKKRKPRVVWGHDWNAPIGKVIDIYEVGPTDPRLFGPYPLNAPTNHVIQAPLGDLRLLSVKDVLARFHRIDSVGRNRPATSR